VDDLVRLALRRTWEALETGTASVSLRDLAALVRLAREQPPGGPDAERWKRTTREVLWLARSHLGDRWPEFAAACRASQALQDLWPPGP
jgi:hypothetical protein